MKRTKFNTVCDACEDGRICQITTNREWKQDPETCPWSNVAQKWVYAPFVRRTSPADISKEAK